jgi:hypothetical protein
MRGTAKDLLLAQTFVNLVDTVVDEFDAVDLLTLLADRSVEILGVTAAGLMLVSGTGKLEEVASSSDAIRVAELFELQSEEGPSLDVYRSGRALVNQHLATAPVLWPRFAPMAMTAGFQTVHALPMRLRGDFVGAFSLFDTEDHPMNESDVMAAQALADVATISILHNRAACDAQLVNEQLNHALKSHGIIEQAKGILMERLAVDAQQAFSRLRHHARNHNRRLYDVSQDIVDGSVRSEDFDPR